MANKTTTTLSGAGRQSPAAGQIVAKKRLIVVAISACFACAPVWSNPTAPQVVNGSASFNQAGKLLTVNNTNGAIINWNTFSIAAGETTRFNQASTASSVLNRVIANDPSVLLGTLSSNGRVWLVNPAGIMVGQGARIDVAGFIASTLNVRNEDFLAGRLNFGATPNAGGIQNYGQITTPSGGSVYLVAPVVENHGIINAPNGEVILAAGQTAQLIDTGTPGVKVNITGAEGNVTNLGEIVAEAGRIGMAGVLVKNSGTLNASSLVREGGRVFLKATKDVTLDSASQIKADGGQAGNGGNILVWADDKAQVDGGISARGGSQSGDGGFIETSGAHVKIAETARVSTLASNGTAGTWLIDPANYTIAASGGDITGATLGTNLVSTSVTISSTDGTINTSGNGDIFVNDAVSWNSANSLTLNALRNISIDAAVTSTGAGQLTLNGTGSITQTAPITVAGMELLGAGGNYQLNHAGNVVGTLAGNTGSVSFTNNAANLSIGTVNTTVGLTTTGDVAITATAGRILSGSGGVGTDISAGGTLDLTATGIGYQLASYPYTTYRLGMSAVGATTLTTTGVGNQGDIYLRADAPMALGSVTTDAATAQRVDLLQSVGSLTMPVAQSGNDNWYVDAASGITFQPASSLTVGSAVFLGSGITAQGDLSIHALTGDLSFGWSGQTPITADGIVNLVLDNGSLVLGAVTTSNTGLPDTTAAINVSAPLGTIDLYGNLNATGSGGISLLADGSIDLDYGDIAPNLITAAGNVNIQSTNGSITNGGSARVTGANVLLDGAFGVNTGDIITATTGSVTVLAAGGTAALNGIDAATGVAVTAGSITNSYENIATTGGNISLASASDITLYGYWGGNALTTSGGNVLLNADSDGLNGGAIAMLGGGSITSNGGNITLGGGTAGNGTGNAIGNATYISGIYLTGAMLDAGGGNIALNGTRSAGTSFAGGVYVTDSSTIQTSGAGTITLNGTGGAGTTGNNYGVVLGTNAALSSVNGAISITGVGTGSGGSNYGVYIHNGATVGATGSGTITLDGTGSAAGTTQNHGIRLSASTPGTQITSASGAISMTGIGGTDGDGLQVANGAKVQSGTGAITLDGTTGDGGSTNDGVYLTGAGTLVTSGGNIGITGTSITTVGTGNRGVAITSSAQVIATGAGTITVTGQGGHEGDGLHVHGGALVQSGIGLITLSGTSGDGVGTNWDWGVEVGDAGTLVTSGGGMTITGISTSTDGTYSNYGLLVRTGAKLTTSAGLMTLNGTRGAGTTSDAVRLSGTPTGGVVNAAEGLSINGMGDVVVDTGAIINVGTGDANFSTDRNILFSAGSSLASSAGPVNVSLYAGNDGGIYGGIYLDTGSSISSNGGNIQMGGGSSGGYALGNGTVTGGISFNSGIYVLGDITAGAGDVTMRGEGASNNLADGITFAGGTLSSNGIVTIDGIAHFYGTNRVGLNPFAAGVNFINAGTRLSTQTGTVTVTGTNTAPWSGIEGAGGIIVETGAIVETTGAGTLTFNGAANSYGASWGVGVLGTIQTTAAGGGAISLNGTNLNNADGGVVIWDGHVLSGGGAINLTGQTSAGGSAVGWLNTAPNALALGGPNSGNITIRGLGAADRIDFSSNGGFAHVIDAGSSALSITSATGFPLNNVQISAGDVTLSSGGAVTDNNASTSSITANTLRLLGTGSYALGSVNNDVGTLAANVTGTVNYNDTNGFAIGSVTSFDGTAVTTTSGVTTGNSSFTAVANSGGTPGDFTLNAGSAINTGTGALNLAATGGNLNVNGDVSAGTFTLSGGTWNQVSTTLPGFAVTDFRIAGGTFIRALGGDGLAAGTAYQLADIYGVQGMGSAGMLDKNYKLANDIGAAGTVNWNAGAGFAPVGSNSSSPFSGSLDGQSHIITGLTNNRPATDYVGMFGYNSGTVSNVGLVGSSVTGRDDVGALIGHNNYGFVSNSYAAGGVSGRYRVGGLVGYNSGDIADSYNTGSVSGTNFVGGLVGYHTGSNTISNSYNTGSVTSDGGYKVGGLVGYNAGSISNAYATGDVIGCPDSCSDYVGGLVGYNDGDITSSYATGIVTGGSYVGGLVGYNAYDANIITSSATGSVGGSNYVGGLVGYNAYYSTVSNSYATGPVTGGDYVGGLVGYNDGDITSSYATGIVIGDYYVGGLVGYNDSSGTITNAYATSSVSGYSSVGGLVGYDENGSNIDSYWDTDTSGQNFSGGNEVGLTTAEMMSLATFTPSWDITGSTGTSTWRIYEGNTAPLLRSFLKPLTVTANAASRTFDGAAYSGGNGVTYSPVSSPALSGTLAYTGTSQGAINAGSYAITPSGFFSGQQGYDISYASGLLTINPAALTLVSIGAALTGTTSKTYDGTTNATLAPGNFLLSGFVNADSASVTKTSGTYASKNVGSNILVSTSLGSSDFSPGGSTNLSNYILPTSAVGNIGVITPASLSLTGLAAQNKVYDATTVATLTGGTLTGVIAGDAVSLASPTGSFNNKNVGNAKPVSVTGLALSGTDAGNYSFTPPTGSTLTADITPASLTLTGLTAQNKVYDATTVATLTGTAAFSGVLGSDVVTLGGSASARFADKNVGIAKPVSVTGLSLTGADAGNYTLGNTTAATSADITARALNVTAKGVNKVYDGQTNASVTYADDRVAGDVLTPSGSAKFLDKNVGVAKPVNVSGITLTGADAGNYIFNTTAATSADITVRPLSTWKGGASGNWSVAANWDALPDLSNVLAVAVPTGSVTYDAAAGSTNLASLTAAGLSIAGGSLNIANSLTVSSSFSQSGGALGFDGSASASITQASGNLNLPAVTLANLSLAAPAGAITQSGAIVAAALNTQSQTGTTLTNAGNKIASFTATNSGNGDVVLTNTGALTVPNPGIINSFGNIVIDNTGAVTTVGPVRAPNGVLIGITAHSPLTIGAGGVSAVGNIVLTAGNTSGSNDNLTLSGPVSSTGSGGSVALTAGDDLVQNANVTTNGGAVSATAQTGNISMALGTTTSTGGGSIGYTASSGNVVLTSLDAGSGAIALNAGKGIQPAPGFAGANLTGGSAVIAAGGSANLSTQVRLLDVTVEGKFSIADVLTGAVMTDVPAAPPLPTTTAPVLSQVLSTVVATTQQQPTQAATQTPAAAAVPPPLLASASGSSGPLLFANTTQTIGGTANTFGGSSAVDSLPATSAGSSFGAPASSATAAGGAPAGSVASSASGGSGGTSGAASGGGGDKPAADKPTADRPSEAKPADDKLASAKKDDTKAEDKKEDDKKKKDEETPAKKDEAKPAAKKLATCS